MHRLALLHAFPFDATFWEPLRRALPGVEIVAPNLLDPDDDGREPSTIDEMADAVAARISGLPSGRACVAGCSMGGYVALSLAARHPSVVSGLVAIDTRAEPDTAEGRSSRDAAIASVRRLGVAAFADDLLPRLIATQSTGVVAFARAIARRQSIASVERALVALRDRPDRRGDLGAIRVPTLVIVGELDRATPPAAAEVISDAIPGAELVVLSGLGHLTPIEDPEAIADRISMFLGRIDLT